MDSGRQIIDRWFQRVWAEESDSAIEEMFRPGGTASGLGAAPLQGAADFKVFRDAMLVLLRDVRIEIRDHLENEQMNAAICTLTARRRRTGKEVSMDGCCHYATEDGVIARADNYWDFIELFEQLGCIGEGTFARALSGVDRA